MNLLAIIKTFASGYELKYTKFYIGLAENGRANNFAKFQPQKTSLRAYIRLPVADDIQQIINEAGFEDTGYDRRDGRYCLRLTNKDIAEKSAALADLLQRAYENAK